MPHRAQQFDEARDARANFFEAVFPERMHTADTREPGELVDLGTGTDGLQQRTSAVMNS